MQSRGHDGIVLVSSGAALIGAANMVANGATKAFDMVMAESLWAELTAPVSTCWAWSWARPTRRRCVGSSSREASTPTWTRRSRALPSPRTWSRARYYDDELVETGEGWKIARRRFTMVLLQLVPDGTVIDLDETS